MAAWESFLYALLPGDLWLPLMGFAGAAAGLYLFTQGFRMLRYKRMILDTPFSKIRSASMGLVEVSGMPKGDHTLAAPVTGAPCFYYRVKVWQWRESENRGEWKQVLTESMYVPFYLDDGTGKVLINPQGAEMEVHRDFSDEISSVLFNQKGLLPENVRNFLAWRGVVPYEKVKVEEQVIKPDYPLFVFGTLGENNDAMPGVAQRHEASGAANPFTLQMGGIRIRLGRDAEPDSGAPRGPIVLPDNVAENLRSKGVALPVAVMTETEAAENKTPAANAPKEKVAICKGERGEPFTISSESQRDVVRELSWKSTLYIWGGPVLTLICVYFLMAYWGWIS